jgi:energy-coupling factor transporter ATP-binding protein EcfA2
MSAIGTIHIERFKSIYDAEFEPGAVNVFIGANGAGKSNILEALGIIGAAAAGRIDDQALLRRGVRPGVPRIYKSAFPKSKKDPSIRITVKDAIGEAEYFVGIVNQGKKPQPFWHFQHERIKAGAETIASRGPASGSARVHGKKISDERSTSLAPQARSNLATSNAARELLSALDDYAIFAPTTPVLRGIAPDSAPRAPVGLYGGGLPDAVDSLTSAPKKKFRQRALALIEWARDFDVGPPSASFISASVPTLRSVVRFKDAFMRDNEQTLSGYDASEGALYLMHLLVLAMHPQSPRVFSIDNFDQALNPSVARAATLAFASEVLFHKRQTFLTTHNPLVLDGLPLDDDRVRLFRVERTDIGHTKVHRVPVEDLHALKQMHGPHAVSRLWIEGRLGGLARVEAI